MKSNLILTILIAIQSSIMAMEIQEKQLPTIIPNDVLYSYIAPFLIEEIIKQEQISVKSARYDLCHLSRINKKFNEQVTKKLANEKFTEFFVNTLAEKKLLEGNKFAIAAHLGTSISMQWFKKRKKEDSTKNAIAEALLIIDQLDEHNYLKNAHCLLWHLTSLLTRRTIYFKPSQNPLVNINGSIKELNKLKQDNKITVKILSLIQEFTIFKTLTTDQSTGLMEAINAHRPDLLPLLYKDEILNHQNSEGFTALMRATVNAFVSADEPDFENRRQNSIKSLEFILSKQPDFTLKTKKNYDVLWMATVNYKKCAQHDSIMELLKRAQNDQNISKTSFLKNDNH